MARLGGGSRRLSPSMLRIEDRELGVFAKKESASGVFFNRSTVLELMRKLIVQYGDSIRSFDPSEDRTKTNEKKY